ncbi:4-hydroxy-tetrahydrodipicolinate synthase [Tepiditoga spiralis]|uniref:4-hydroxy-tetrahydrodipicolinate synthase n=1 Tax=Tepiditoga spiralis TaxID=2108365 RepID=A0A7G1G391_9BACT|nr:4-hydroxy-tetrahydrodipicolinate synthase [Tepiditoga spiralis]BBE30860.1 4-hydroxy-tetrahydrodipicolinate synthase [Tepiditoga spiralis]
MFKGVGTAIITPFDSELNIDYVSLEKLINFQLKYVDALIVLGTTGEAPTITEKEREKLINFVIEKTNKKVPVIIGTGSNDTKKILKYNKISEKANADGLLIVTPYYNKTTQFGLKENYKYISERTSLPIILYNVPSRTGVNILPDTAIDIFNKNKNVIGIKEASGNISQINTLISKKPNNMLVYSGNDDQVIPIMSLGGDGVISVISNILPKIMKNLTTSILNNDYITAKDINKKYNELMNKLFIEVNPIPIKYAASKLNLCKNKLRLPLVSLSSENQKILDELLKEIKI